MRQPQLHQLEAGEALGSGEAEANGEKERDEDKHLRLIYDLPEQLVRLHDPDIRLLTGLVQGEICLIHEECNTGSGYYEDHSPEQHELAEGDDPLALQGGEQDEAHDPARSLTHRVAGGGVADIARLEHGQRPAVHHNVLGGGQEEQDREHDGQGEDVRYKDTLEDEVMV